MIKNIDEKIAGAAGGVSGAASILGSWQVCHSVCMSLIGLLGVIGITITGMPLAFLTTVTIPVWIIAVLLFGLLVYFYFARHCVSKNLILVNAGLIIAGTPFPIILPVQQVFWGAGGSVTVFGIVGVIIGKFSKKNERCCK